jgi:hypothetical protein
VESIRAVGIIDALELALGGRIGAGARRGHGVAAAGGEKEGEDGDRKKETSHEFFPESPAGLHYR